MNKNILIGGAVILGGYLLYNILSKNNSSAGAGSSDYGSMPSVNPDNSLAPVTFNIPSPDINLPSMSGGATATPITSKKDNSITYIVAPTKDAYGFNINNGGSFTVPAPVDNTNLNNIDRSVVMNTLGQPLATNQKKATLTAPNTFGTWTTPEQNKKKAFTNQQNAIDLFAGATTPNISATSTMLGARSG